VFLVSVWIFFEAAAVEICYTLFQKNLKHPFRLKNSAVTKKTEFRLDNIPVASSRSRRLRIRVDGV